MSLHPIAVPAFLQILKGMSGALAKAEAHCEAKKIQPEALLNARLYPDMFTLTKQVQLAGDFAAKSCARLTGAEVPSYPDVEKSFAELIQRVATARDTVKGVTAAQFEGAETRMVTVPAGAQPITLPGLQFLTGFALPNFYFHAATAYGILRHNGVELGKRDFLGMT